MKKLLALILALTMVFALAACGSEPAANSDAPSGDDVPSGEAVELTLTCNGTDQGNDTRSAKRFKELIEEKSEGRITINIINNDQLAGGNMTSAIELLTGGGTDIDIHSTSIISSIAPEAMVCTMPWLFSDYQAAEDAFFGAGGEYMTELLSKQSEEDQQLVFDLVEQASKEVNAELVAEEEELIAQCEEENGVQFYRFTDEDVETWRAVITDLIEEYKGVYGEAACTAFGVE